ncbi:MAG TPA: cold shock domain-containing protein [Pirellulales bacterium]|nr:cold shock domain-containing protein [Pirellulales bacterium]
MAIGTIKKLFVDKHCGFIAVAQGPDVFFHGTTVTAGNDFRSLAVGQRVEYELDTQDQADDRGPRAARVRPLGGAAPAAAPPPGEFRPLRRHRAARAKKPTWRNKSD